MWWILLNFLFWEYYVGPDLKCFDLFGVAIELYLKQKVYIFALENIIFIGSIHVIYVIKN